MYNILVADDSALMRKLMCDIINSVQNFSATDVCVDGENTYRHIMENHYDAVTLNMLMPRVSGKEIMQRMKQNGNKTPVIAISVENDKLSYTAFDLGAKDFIVRPFRLSAGGRPEFEKTLEVAEKEIEKVEVRDEVSDVPCDKCGAMMVYKMGRYGKFLACPNFPDCRNTKPILQYIEAPCPKCGKRLLVKMSKKNRRFYGCEGYPDCDFISWDKPAEEKCPKCGQYMIEKQNNKGEKIHLCTNESCRFKTTVQSKEEETE